MRLATTTILLAACSAQAPAARVHLEGMHEVPEAALRDALKGDDPKHDELWLLAALYDRGYVQAKVETHASANDVTYHIDEGARFRVGAVSGPLHRLKSGDWFSRKAVMEDLAELRAQYGHEITPTTKIDAEKKTIDIDVPVEREGAAVH